MNVLLGTQTMMDFGVTIEEKALSFHRSHPEVYSELVRLCREAKARGRRKLGIGLLWERMRWTFYIEQDEDDFKLNNNFRSRYARWIMEREPDLDGIFDTRELQTA